MKVPPKIGRSSLPKWRVEIINWPLLFGLGETKTEAYWDFPVDDSEEEIARKIMLRYGEDVSELIKKGFLVEIFERINESGKII